MPDLGVPELLIIAVVVLVLFGSKKLPDAARSLGRSLRIFKAETKGLQDETPTMTQQPQQAQPAVPVAPAPAAVAPAAAPAPLPAADETAPAAEPLGATDSQR